MFRLNKDNKIQCNFEEFIIHNIQYKQFSKMFNYIIINLFHKISLKREMQLKKER